MFWSKGRTRGEERANSAGLLLMSCPRQWKTAKLLYQWSPHYPQLFIGTGLIEADCGQIYYLYPTRVAWSFVKSVLVGQLVCLWWSSAMHSETQVSMWHEYKVSHNNFCLARLFILNLACGQTRASLKVNYKITLKLCLISVLQCVLTNRVST